MFDVSMAEVIVVGGVAMLLLGKHDMPLVFRLVGRGVGKVSGLIQGGRARMHEMSTGSDLLQLQNEIRSNLDDLRVIKAELRGAAQLPLAITKSSHPGSSALKNQGQAFGISPPGGGDSPIIAPPSYKNPAEDYLSSTGAAGSGGGGRDSAMGSAIGATASSRETYLRSPSPVDRLHTANLGATGAGQTAKNVALGSDGDGGSGGGGSSTTRLGSSPLPPPRRAMKGALSPGGDRLQRLAMAEIGFAEKDLYAPKTDSIPGGADIINETITDSLLHERYRRMLGVARGGANGGAK